MEERISGLEIVHRRLLGQRFKLFFQPIGGNAPTKVLELVNVVGFLEYNTSSVGDFTISLRDEEGRGGSFAFDLSLRSQRSEVAHFPEVILFKGDSLEFAFRGVAEEIYWRDYDRSPQGDLNY